jgi:hypothetical protein
VVAGERGRCFVVGRWTVTPQTQSVSMRDGETTQLGLVVSSPADLRQDVRVEAQSAGHRTHSWTNVEPQARTIDAHSSGDFLVSLSPPRGTASGTFVVDFVALSRDDG